MAGAVINDYNQRTQPDALGGVPAPFARPIDTTGASNADELAMVGKSLTHGMYALRERAEEEARAWSADALSKARLDWTVELKNRQESAQPNAPDFTPTLIKDFDEYKTKLVETAPTDIAKNFISRRLDEFRAQLGANAVEFEAQARVDYRTDKFNSGIDNASKLMNTDPAQYESTLAEQLATIDASALPPVKKSAIRQSAIDRVSTAAVWSKIQRDPGAWLDSIGFIITNDGKARRSSGALDGVTGDKAFDILPFEKRAKLFESALQLKNQVDADADRAGKEKIKALADDGMKEIWSAQASGKLTRSFIELYRPVLSAEQYHSALTALKGGDGPKSDPATFRQLMQLQADGKYDEARAFAFKAHRNGLLSNEHLKSEVDKIYSLERQGGPKTEYERSRQYLVQSLDPGPMVHDPVGKSRMAEAVYEFDTWANAGKRTDQEVSDYGKQLVQRYRLVDLSDTLISLPSPRSGMIRRNPADQKGLVQDIAGAATKADTDFKNGRLTESEYNAEMSLLNRWRKAAMRAQGQK